jgi:DNA-binding NarL/FixJ family response regulator
MRRNSAPLLVSRDSGLLQHWRDALKVKAPIEVGSFSALRETVRRSNDVVWLDLSISDTPSWSSPDWANLIKDKQIRIVATSSHPRNEEAIAALDAGCAGYCHAYSDPGTLLQVQRVIAAGHVWIGSNLMQQLIQTAHRAATDAVPPSATWENELTSREREVAVLVARGSSNAVIAEACGITERTVKAHLSAIFEKTGSSDRLQLALKVHGIQ